MANNTFTTDYDVSLTAKHIATNLQNYEAARTGFFTFIVDDLDGIVRADYKGTLSEPADGDRIMKAQEYLKLNVTKASVPHFSIAPLEYRRGNEQIKFAGVPSFEAGSITVDDVVGLDTKSILMAWHALAYDIHTRKGGRMGDWTDQDGVVHKGYKKTCTLAEYTQDYELVRTWTLYGCWISDLSEEDFDKENDGKRQISVTIQYDRAEMELPRTAK